MNFVSPPPLLKYMEGGMPSAATAQVSTSSEEHVLFIIIKLISIEELLGISKASWSDCGPGPINLIRHLSRLQVTMVLQGESWEMAATVNQTRAFNLSFYSSDASSRTGQHCWVEQIRPRQCQATCGAGPAIEGALHLLFPPGYAAILCAALGDAPALSWVRKMGRIQCQNITFFFFYFLHDFMLTNQSPKTFPSHLSSPRWPPCRPAQAKSATVLESLLQTGAEWEPPQTSLEW